MILVTGGLGFLGSHIALDLMSKGHEVVLVDNLSHSSMETVEHLEYITKMYIPFVRLDIRNTPALQKVFEQYPIDYVINATGFKSLHESQIRPLDYYNNNVGTLMSLLRAMQRASIRRLVNLSSVMVYGENGLTWKEDAEINQKQTQPYIRIQQFNEQILQDVYKVDDYWQILNVRLSNVMGAHPTHHLGEWIPPLPNSVLPSLLQVATQQRDLFEIYNQNLDTHDGTSIRSYLHVMDATEAIYKLMLWSNDQKNFLEHINISHDDHTSLKELINEVEKQTQSKINIEQHHTVAEELTKISGDNAKLKALTQWSPQYKLEDMVRDQLRFYQTQSTKRRTKLSLKSQE